MNTGSAADWNGGGCEDRVGGEMVHTRGRELDELEILGDSGDEVGGGEI
jgi:hypothetical protein